MKHMRLAISLVVVSLLVLILAVPVFAQNTSSIELFGIVEAVGTATLTVNGLTVDIAAAQVNVVPAVDMLVQIEGTLSADGLITASEVNAASEGAVPGETELVGILDSLTNTEIVVSGLVIDVTAAQIKLGVAVGARVKVQMALSTGGTWTAREVERYTSQDDHSSTDDSSTAGEFEFTGTLEAVGTDTITVGGMVIDMTQVQLRDTLMIGTRVRVHATLVNGVMTAYEVENAFRTQTGNDDSSSDDSDDSSSDVSSAVPTISAQDAVASVLAVYPNTSIMKLELKFVFNNTLVWEIKTSHGLEILVDATNGTILTIDERSSSDDGSNHDENDDSSDNHGSGQDDNDHNDDSGHDDDSGQDDNDHNDDSGQDNDSSDD